MWKPAFIRRRVSHRRRLTSAEFWLLCIALPVLVMVMAGCVISLVVMAINFF